MSDGLKPHWFHILFALLRGPLHGSGIVEEVLERTEGATKLWPATLYGSLRDLTEVGWLQESDVPEDAVTEGGRPRFYELTPEGRAVLEHEVSKLARIVDTARSRGLLEGPGVVG